MVWGGWGGFGIRAAGKRDPPKQQRSRLLKGSGHLASRVLIGAISPLIGVSLTITLLASLLRPLDL